MICNCAFWYQIEIKRKEMNEIGSFFMKQKFPQKTTSEKNRYHQKPFVCVYY